MYLGRVCELAPDPHFIQARLSTPLYQSLCYQRSRAWTANIAQPIRLIGEVPTPTEKPIGCVFSGSLPLRKSTLL